MIVFGNISARGGTFPKWDFPGRCQVFLVHDLELRHRERNPGTQIGRVKILKFHFQVMGRRRFPGV